MNNLLDRLQLPKMFIVITLLGVYSASMYKIALLRPVQTDIVDMPISVSTDADMEKILEVVKPRVHGEGSTTYLPGVACIIEAGPETTVEMMEEYFSTCISEHYIFTSTEPFTE